MESTRRVQRRSVATKVSSAASRELHSRALVRLILHDVILSNADTQNKRIVIAYSRAMLAALLASERRRTEVSLLNLVQLDDKVFDRILAAVPYVRTAKYRLRAQEANRRA